jgi:hypothetical protein
MVVDDLGMEFITHDSSVNVVNLIYEKLLEETGR